jgi:hypothetical protein
MKQAWILVAAIASIGACGSEDDPTTEGTAKLSFGVTNGVRQNINLVDELDGDIYGQLFLSFEVTLTGPIEGAQPHGDVEMLGVDLTTDEVTVEVWTSGMLEQDEYTFLGFFDVDGNGSDTRDPDAGDPVTLPVTNKFDVKPGEEVEITAMFDLVYN